MKIFRWLFGACIAAFASSAIGALCTIDSVEHGGSDLRVIFNEKVNGGLHIIPNPGIPYDYRVINGQVLNQEMQPIDLILKDGTSAYFNGGDVHTGCTFTAVNNSEISGIETINWTQIGGRGTRSKEFIKATTRSFP